MKRLFAALELHADSAFEDTLGAFKAKLSQERISWVGLHHLHLTLKFFGETAEEKIPAIREAMHLGVTGIPPFSICFNKIGIFGSSYRPKVIWLGAEADPTLARLFTQLRTELEKAGFTYDRQNFVPHLTLGRIREISDMASFQKHMGNYRETFSLVQNLDALQLYESVLTPKGPIYTVLETAIFKS